MALTNSIRTDISALLEKNGPMGVNQIAKELDIPLSTIQKYLDKDQNYFKKNSQRKWVLPHDAVNDDMSSISDNFDTIIDSQLSGIDIMMNTLMSQFKATRALMGTRVGTFTPVAGISSNIHPTIAKMDKNLKDSYDVFKKYMSKAPEEYQDLLKNVDLYEMATKLGTKFMNEVFFPEVTSLFLEQTTELSEEVLKLLEEYQNG